MTRPLPEIRLSGSGDEPLWWTSSRGRWRLNGFPGKHIEVQLERCALGRLRNSYPVSAFDIEVEVFGATGKTLTDVLRATAEAVFAQEPSCRRLVYAVTRVPDDETTENDQAEAAADAGFRFVVDIDTDTEELILFVAEPGWVTSIDPDLDSVPGT